VKLNRAKTDPLFLMEELVDRLSSQYDQVLLEKFAISYSEWRLMLAIFLAQDNPTQETIAAYAVKTPAAVSRQLAILESKDLVERSESKLSKRTKQVKLSKQGRNIFNRSLQVVSKLSHNVLRQLGGEQMHFKDSIITLLDYLDTEAGSKE
jgi:DNA-binding MarR family transcriptional regulator